MISSAEWKSTRVGPLKGFPSGITSSHSRTYEEFTDINTAIQREKQLKKWERAWKDELIEELNPVWNDLSAEWFVE